jgi:hypothetical protein
MQFEGHVDALILMRIENWLPAAGEFVKGRLNEASWEWRPRIKKRPRERAPPAN